jgi:CheY-like chemotaxis protein
MSLQISLTTLPNVIQSRQQNSAGMDTSQLYIIVACYILLLHNLFLLRNYRNDYATGVRLRLNFLPQGVGNLPTNPTRNRMIQLVQQIVTETTSIVENSPCDNALERPDTSRDSSTSCSDPNSLSLDSKRSSEQAASCAAIKTLLYFLQDASCSKSQVCNVSEVCLATINQCMPLLKNHSISIEFAGRQRFLPLRVMLVDDSAFVRSCLRRFARNRGYYYVCCSDGVSAVKAFEATLLMDPRACSRFDLIIMDKEMPTTEPDSSSDSFRKAGVFAVKKIRELSQEHALREPGFRGPCIVGNSACGDPDEPTFIQFRNELELSRQQAGMPSTMLTLREKMSGWSDEFDVAVREMCGMVGAQPQDTCAPTVWGKPIRLQMLFRNLITNAIQHGKPCQGEQRIHVSYDLIDQRARMHPCLVRSDQDNEVARSLSWHLSGACENETQRFVQVMVTDNGPGMDGKKQPMPLARDGELLAETSASGAVELGARFFAQEGGMSNFGICLQRIVCPEVANNHGAMGVHSRIEPSPGCSFVVALPYFCEARPWSHDSDAV